MRISTRGRYGLRAMVVLAKHYGQGPLLMRMISEDQEIPRKYLHALLTSLRSRGLVRSLRGSRGGYTLAREPSQITALDVVTALEGGLMLVDCSESGRRCKRYLNCSTRALWEDLCGMLKERLASVTLEDLAQSDQEAVSSGQSA